MKELRRNDITEVVAICDWVSKGYLDFDDWTGYLHGKTTFLQVAEKAVRRSALQSIHNNAIRKL